MVHNCNHPSFDNPYYTPSQLGLNNKFIIGARKKIVEEIVTVRQLKNDCAHCNCVCGIRAEKTPHYCHKKLNRQVGPLHWK